MLVAGFVGGVSGPHVGAAPPAGALPLAQLFTGANPASRTRVDVGVPPSASQAPVEATLFGGNPLIGGSWIQTPPALPPPVPAGPPVLQPLYPSARLPLAFAFQPIPIVTGPLPSALAPGFNPRPPTSPLVAQASAAAPLPLEATLAAGSLPLVGSWLLTPPASPIDAYPPAILQRGASPSPPIPTALVARASAAAELPPDVTLWPGALAYAGMTLTTPVPLVPAPAPVVALLPAILLAGPPLSSKLPLIVEAPRPVAFLQGATLTAARTLAVVALPPTVTAAPVVALRVGAVLPPSATSLRVQLPLATSPAPTVQLRAGAIPTFTPTLVWLPTTSLVSPKIVTTII